MLAVIFVNCTCLFILHFSANFNNVRGDILRPMGTKVVNHEPILRLLNLQPPTTHGSTYLHYTVLGRRKYLFVVKTHRTVRCVVKFYTAGVVTHDRRIGSSSQSYTRLLNLQLQRQHFSMYARPFFKLEENIFHGVVKILQRWRCNSRSWDWLRIRR
jgi:hypothetical protein